MTSKLLINSCMADLEELVGDDGVQVLHRHLHHTLLSHKYTIRISRLVNPGELVPGILNPSAWRPFNPTPQTHARVPRIRQRKAYLAAPLHAQADELSDVRVEALGQGQEGGAALAVHLHHHVPRLQPTVPRALRDHCTERKRGP
jgi:hypothetical protein